MKPTTKEIESALTELKESMLEAVSLDEKEEKIKLLRQANHKRLCLAREAVRSLRLE